MGDRLLPAVRPLPSGKAGIVFRQYHTPSPERRQLYAAVRTIARRRRLLLILAVAPRADRAWKAEGWHGKTPQHGHPMPATITRQKPRPHTARGAYRQKG